MNLLILHFSTTIAMRDKEKLHDYRFMPEPNLPPLRLHSKDTSPSGIGTTEVNNVLLLIVYRDVKILTVVLSMGNQNFAGGSKECVVTCKRTILLSLDNQHWRVKEGNAWAASWYQEEITEQLWHSSRESCHLGGESRNMCLEFLKLQAGNRKDWRQAGYNSTNSFLFVSYMLYGWSPQDEWGIENYKLAWSKKSINYEY